MWTLGIDVGKRRHVATLLDAQGQTVFRNYGFAQSRDGVAGLLGRAKANQLKQAAQQSFALRGRQETLALEIRFLVERLNVLLGQIEQLDEQLGEWMAQQ